MLYIMQNLQVLDLDLIGYIIPNIVSFIPCHTIKLELDGFMDLHCLKDSCLKGDHKCFYFFLENLSILGKVSPRNAISL